MNAIIKRFLEWVGLKEKLHGQKHHPPLFKEGEVWWCYIGENIAELEESESKKIRDGYVALHLSYKNRPLKIDPPPFPAKVVGNPKYIYMLSDAINKSSAMWISKKQLILVFSILILGFIALVPSAHAALILQAPKYIGHS